MDEKIYYKIQYRFHTAQHDFWLEHFSDDEIDDYENPMTITRQTEEEIKHELDQIQIENPGGEYRIVKVVETPLVLT